MVLTELSADMAIRPAGGNRSRKITPTRLVDDAHDLLATSAIIQRGNDVLQSDLAPKGCRRDID